MSSFAFALVPSLSKERRASTSVETRPGMIARISLPNSTSCDVKHRKYSGVARYEELAHQTVSSGLNLLVKAAALLLAVLNSSVDQALVGGLAGSLENE